VSMKPLLVIVKVAIPKGDRDQLPRDKHGKFLGTVEGHARYKSTVQPLSSPVFETCVLNMGTAYFTASYSELLKMWVVQGKVNAQDW
jgi:hypothetical protein